MANQTNLSEVIAAIQSDVKAIVAGEIELAKAEMVPQMKQAGLGAGMFGAAGYLALTGAHLLFFGASFAAAAIYWNLVPQPWPLVLGFATVALISLVLAGALALMGKSKVKVKGPTSTIAHGQESVAAVKSAISAGQAEVNAPKSR